MGDTKYGGKEQILVAMDIGTTRSAVSFAYLYPEDYVRIRMVNKWPGQPESAGSSKIPTLLAYRHGECKACGPDALEYVDDNSYQTAKWFKLQLHPPSMKVSNLPPPYGSPTNSSILEIPPLPSGVAIEQVYADFMKYLMGTTQKCFEESIPNGATIWRRLRETVLVVLTTPNGWELSQQSTLRNSVITAGLVKAEKTHELLDFVTEGEASVHYALAYSQSKTWLFPGSVFAVIDAGGSTVDSTLYECKSMDPKVNLEEVCPSGCVQAGGIFVDRAAEVMLRQKLQGSKFGDEESIGEMVEAFETRVCCFYISSTGSHLYLGRQSAFSTGAKSPALWTLEVVGIRDRIHGIIKGKLSLTRQEVEATFDDVIKRIVESGFELLDGRKVQYIILAGGFGESPYLKSRLVALLDGQGVTVVTADEPSKKTAAEGALIWFIKQTVMARVARYTIGVQVEVPYSPSLGEHARRKAGVYRDLGGFMRLPNGFDFLVLKGHKMAGEFTNKRSYQRFTESLTARLGSFSVKLLIWDGKGVPKWCTDANGLRSPQMRTLCTMNADLSELRGSLSQAQGPGGTYYVIDHQVVVRFGGTQLQATIQWKEGETLREGPVTIIPNAII